MKTCQRDEPDRPVPKKPGRFAQVEVQKYHEASTRTNVNWIWAHRTLCRRLRGDLARLSEFEGEQVSSSPMHSKKCSNVKSQFDLAHSGYQFTGINGGIAIAMTLGVLLTGLWPNESVTARFPHRSNWKILGQSLKQSSLTNRFETKICRPNIAMAWQRGTVQIRGVSCGKPSSNHPQNHHKITING